jgi:hypothetical protein
VKLVDQLLVSARERICARKQQLAVSFAARHAALCTAGQAAQGGGLIPLSEWREVLVDVTCLQLAWSELPQTFQERLASVLSRPAKLDENGGGGWAGGSSSAPLDPSLYPAVQYEKFLERFYVTLRPTLARADDGPGGHNNQDAGPLFAHMLGIVYSQSFALKKALSIAAAETPASASGRMSLSASRAVNSSVSVEQFISAVEALVGAVDERHVLTHADFVKLAEVAPKDAQGRVLFVHFLDNLIITDKQSLQDN